MKNKNMTLLKSILYGFVVLIQISLVTVVIVLDGLTTKKAGVMRHIYTRRLQYEQTIFSSSNLLKHSILGGILAVLFIMILIYVIKTKQNLFLRIQLMLGVVMSLLVPIVINSNYFINMMSYSYFIIAFELILLAQIIVIASTYVIINSK